MKRSKKLKSFTDELKRQNLLLDLESDDDETDKKEKNAERSHAKRLGVVWDTQGIDNRNDVGTWGS